MYDFEGVLLTRETVEELKSLNTDFPSAITDGKFLKQLLVAVFKEQVLSVSSVYGHAAHNTEGYVQHQALDEHKLGLVRSK